MNLSERLCKYNVRRENLQICRTISLVVCFWLTYSATVLSTDTLIQTIEPEIRRYCVDCHGAASANAAIDFERALASFDMPNQFKLWQRVSDVLATGSMPPAEYEQPSSNTRKDIASRIRDELQSYITKHAGDPGPNALRRLTSAEYGYTIRDLFGLELNLEKSFVNDAVGGEGFTNAGAAQFIEDSALERYLEAAKRIAEHAVIGAGPITFFSDPGTTGKELSSIHRIQKIYREHGFRTGAGEGAEPFGIDLYPRAFYVTWQYRHRESLGLTDSLDKLAETEGISTRFCQYIWNVMNEFDATFPMTQIRERWRQLPVPRENGVQECKDARHACDRLADFVRGWQSTLANSAGNEEESPVLTEGEINVQAKDNIKTKIDWPRGASFAVVEFACGPASAQTNQDMFVLWKNPLVRFRSKDGKRSEETPMISCMDQVNRAILKLGEHSGGSLVGENDFVLNGNSSVSIKLSVPEDAVSALLSVQLELQSNNSATLSSEQNQSIAIRCSISDGDNEGETAAEKGSTSTLLANSNSNLFASWKQGIEFFAKKMPQVSHREPAPSDRDPIPAPFDNTYNRPERNHFHTAIKYHRDDRFLTEHMLDDPTRKSLDTAWTDLLTSFDYHLEMLRFLGRKAGRGNLDAIRAWNQIDTDSLPLDLQPHATRILSEYRRMMAQNRDAMAGHRDNVMEIASRVWRRPLTADDATKFLAFYAMRCTDSPTQEQHETAVRQWIARILVSPEFLYHSETNLDHPRSAVSAPKDVISVPPSVQFQNSDIGQLDSTSSSALSDRELANRLSYFLWSSVPDAILLEAANAQKLKDPILLESQVRRMLRDIKARRLAHEFFGQWLGFYRFDDFKGIDGNKYKEFDQAIRSDMLNESVTFFENFIRNDLPVVDILFADYTFVNSRLAKHYGLNTENLTEGELELVRDPERRQRGGILGMGSIHSLTSAPLRTSAVKRGDWVLRRLLGATVPPPPADAGSIAADEVQSDGLTVRRRLEAHRTARECQNCHSRIDPLGFALESFDPIGRWRVSYSDGQAIDTGGTLSDGTNIGSLAGLKDYLRREQPRLERTLVTKLLGFALGRAELLSDQPLIDQMTQILHRDGKLSDVVIAIVKSKQFTHRRLELSPP